MRRRARGQPPGPSSFPGWPAPTEARDADDLRIFIRANLPLTPVATRPDILLHTAAPASGLRRMLEAGGSDAPPYWAYPWAGGLVLARHLADHPELVAGRRVLDLGCGSGLVAIAAAKGGAREVFAVDIDPHAVVATALNAAANLVTVTAFRDDPIAGPPPPVDLILVGDLFYAPVLAEQVATFLLRCVTAGLEVVIGDPGRAWLPRARLLPLAEYTTPDFGDVRDAEAASSAVYAFMTGADA